MKQITLGVFMLFFTVSSLAQNLQITEIMYNPGGRDTNWEWVEIYNHSDDSIDLSGYVFDDNAATGLSASNITVGMIAPNSVAVLFNAENLTTEQFKEVWGDINTIGVDDWPTLGNSGDTIGLWDSFESYEGDQQSQLNAVESLTYNNNDAGWPDDDGNSSIILMELTTDNSIGSNWMLSSDENDVPVPPAFVGTEANGSSGSDVGSPGIVNSVAIEKPVITCQDAINVSSDTEICSATILILEPIATDTSPEDLTFNGKRSDNLELNAPFEIGETTITWTATNAEGTSSEPCMQLVTVTDAVVPVITCPEDINMTSEDGEAIPITIENATASKPCESELVITGTRSDNEDLEAAYPIGETEISWIAADAFGNSAECIQTITVSFTASSENVINSFAISGQIEETVIDSQNKTIELIVPFGTSVSSVVPEITISADATVSPENGEAVDFTNAVVYTVTAQDGTIQEWLVTVTIAEDMTDSTAPQIECPEDIMVEVDEGQCGAVVDFEVLFEDDQPDATLELSIMSGSLFEVGTTAVSATATDTSGNTASCIFNIVVQDNLPPVIICQNIDVILDSQGMASTSVESLYTDLFDNCGIATIEASQLDFTVENLGMNQVELTATDVNGNVATCSVQVMVTPTENTQLAVTDYMLVNADTNEDLFIIEEGMQIDIATLPTLHLDIRAITSDDVESVRLGIAGAINSERTESLLPYALFQDLPIGNYKGNDFDLGSYTVSAVPYSEDALRGEIGESFSVSFELIDACANFQVTLELISEVVTCGGAEGEMVVATVDGEAPIIYQWSHDATLTDAIASDLTAGTYTVVATDANNCRAEFSFTLKDPELPEIVFLPFEAVSENDEAFELIEGFPVGGVYSGEGVTDGIFDPSIGKGSYQITYTLKDEITGCEASATSVIEVLSNESLAVESFTLINADTNEALFDLEQGMRININSLPTRNLDVRANTSEEVESVRLSISGEINSGRTESLKPFALFQDLPIGDYKGAAFTTGSYSVSGIPYAKDGGIGDVGVTLNIEFELFDNQLSITNFMLVNADTNEDLFLLEEGMVIDSNDLPTLNLDIRAITTADVESVRMSLKGEIVTERTESLEPFALFQDLPIGNYKGNLFVLGSYTVFAIPYSEDALRGNKGNSLAINFEISRSEESDLTVNRMYITPNPANIETQLSFKNPLDAQMITIYDTHGRLIRSFDAMSIKSNNTYNLEIKALQSGTYFVKVLMKNGTSLSGQMLVVKQ